LIAKPIIKVITIRFAKRMRVNLRPINLNNIAIDEIQTADEVNENTMAVPVVRSV
jgi:hypothetical protein